MSGPCTSTARASATSASLAACAITSRAALTPSSWRVQLAPPSSECSTTPSCPTAQPWRGLGKCTATRSDDTGTWACCQIAPSSSEYRMCPRCPTATRRLPACASPLSNACSARADSVAGVSSTSAKRSAACSGMAQHSIRDSSSEIRFIFNSVKKSCQHQGYCHRQQNEKVRVRRRCAGGAGTYRRRCHCGDAMLSARRYRPVRPPTIRWPSVAG